MVASLAPCPDGSLDLKLNGCTVLSINPATGRLILTENLKPSDVPGLTLDSRGAIELCMEDADFYKRS